LPLRAPTSPGGCRFGGEVALADRLSGCRGRKLDAVQLTWQILEHVVDREVLQFAAELAEQSLRRVGAGSIGSRLDVAHAHLRAADREQDRPGK
jgi:hypothetical protein